MKNVTIVCMVTVRCFSRDKAYPLVVFTKHCKDICSELPDFCQRANNFMCLSNFFLKNSFLKISVKCKSTENCVQILGYPRHKTRLRFNFGLLWIIAEINC